MPPHGNNISFSDNRNIVIDFTYSLTRSLKNVLTLYGLNKAPANRFAISVVGSSDIQAGIAQFSRHQYMMFCWYLTQKQSNIVF